MKNRPAIMNKMVTMERLYEKLSLRYGNFIPFTAKDTIWHPHGITYHRICLSIHYSFYYAFQQPVR